MKKEKAALLLIILVASLFRAIGLNWDQGQMLHPDERFLAMVTHDLDWPKSWSEYFDNQNSPLNPYNQGYDFFVYGTLPVFLVKGVATAFSLADYQEIILLGRVVSASFDLGSVLLIALIAKKIFPKKSVFLWASFFYAISVLPIQLAHFYTVDSFVNFFLLLALYLLTRFRQQPRAISLIGMGFSLGAATACKVNALLFAPLFTLGLFPASEKKILIVWVKRITIVAIIGFFFWRLFQPYIFSDLFLPDQKFLANLNSLRNMTRPDSWYPPSLQWQKTWPIIYSIKNIVLWGLGLPLGLLSLAGSICLFSEIKKTPKNNKRKFFSLLAYGYLLATFLYLSCQFVKPMRYLLPLYPAFSLAAGFLTYSIGEKFKNRKKLISTLIAVGCLIWPLSFINIYLQPHSRMKASRWIYQNVTIGSTVSCEYWDDCLPLSISQEGKFNNQYRTQTLLLYDQDNSEKWSKINDQLSQIDYLILSSNRLWRSLIKASERYPETSQFYQDLFDGKLQFNEAAEFSSSPCFPPGLAWVCFNDQGADESFTVYDHPKVIIYQQASF